jgi:hypothetical protein
LRLLALFGRYLLLWSRIVLVHDHFDDIDDLRVAGGTLGGLVDLELLHEGLSTILNSNDAFNHFPAAINDVLWFDWLTNLLLFPCTLHHCSIANLLVILEFVEFFLFRGYEQVIVHEH